MSVVDEEVQSVQHITVVLKYGHLQGGFNDLLYFGLSLLSVMNEFNRLLLILLSEQVSCFLHDSF